MQILSSSEINQPIGALFENWEEHKMGAVENLRQTVINFYGSDKPLAINGDWTTFCSDFDLQRNGLFDPWDCVVCAHQSAIYAVLKAQGVDLIKQSRRYTAIRSGVKPGVGTSNGAVEYAIGRGMVAEKDCVSITPTMTSDQFFMQIAHSFGVKYEDFIKDYDFLAVPLQIDENGKASVEDVAFAQTISPLVISVNGHYTFNDKGQVMRESMDDNHDVLLARPFSEMTTGNTVVDSENPAGFVAFDPQYEWHYPVMILVRPKRTTTLLNPVDGKLVKEPIRQSYVFNKKTTLYESVWVVFLSWLGKWVRFGKKKP